MLKVHNDPKLPGDSGEEFVFNWGGWRLSSRCEILYLLDGKKLARLNRKPRAHLMQGKQFTSPYTKRILDLGRANGLKFTSDCLMLVIYVSAHVGRCSTKEERVKRWCCCNFRTLFKFIIMLCGTDNIP